MGTDTEKFKHTCPACGQHIEYTIDYCGRQIDCPTCHKSVLFPVAVAVGPKKKLRLVRDASGRKKSNPIFAFIHKLIAFPHWKMVATCLLPFALIVGLLYGAAYLRKASANDTVEIPRAITTPVAADGWKKMTQMAQVEDAIKNEIQQARELNQMLQIENAQMQQFDNNSANASLMQQQKSDLNRKMETQRNQLNAIRGAFYQTWSLYQKMGGTIDYNSQYPN